MPGAHDASRQPQSQQHPADPAAATVFDPARARAMEILGGLAAGPGGLSPQTVAEFLAAQFGRYGFGRFTAPSASFGGQQVSLAALVRVEVHPASTGPRTNLPPSVEKSGTTPQDFRVRITNTKTDEVTQALEVYVTLLGEVDAGHGVVVEVVDSPDARVTVDLGDR